MTNHQIGLLQTEDGWVSKKVARYRCSCIGCKEMPIKSVWIHGVSAIDKTKYESLVNVCQKHYDEEKKLGGIVKENGKPIKDDMY